MESYRKIARRIKRILDEGNYSFVTVPYSELQTMYRQEAGDEAVRLSKGVREGISEALTDEGVRVFPPIEESGDDVRFFRSGTILWDMVSNLRYPNPSSDKELADLLNKIKTDSSITIVIKKYP